MFDLVADIGNSRLKWGNLRRHDIFDTVVLPLDCPASWEQQLQKWHCESGQRWLLGGSQPQVLDRLAEFLRQRTNSVTILNDYHDIPLPLRVEQPEQVGIDRLLNALAVVKGTGRGQACVIINAGTAVTVDLVDDTGCFCGGAILPGLRLMAQSLHDYTARLPFVTTFPSRPCLPGKNTQDAIANGIMRMMQGGIDRIVDDYRTGAGAVRVFLAGGDAQQFTQLRCSPEFRGEYLTLEGLRIVAESWR